MIWNLSKVGVAVAIAINSISYANAEAVSVKSSKIEKSNNPIYSRGQLGANKGVDRTLYLLEINPFFASDLLNKKSPIINGDLEKSLGNDRKIKIAISDAADKIASSAPGVFEDYASPILPDYMAWMSDSEVESLRNDSRFSRITQLDSEVKKEKSVKIARREGSESFSPKATPAGWPWSYVGADGSFSSNNVYVIDGRPAGAHPNFNTEVNKEYVENYYSNFTNPIDELYHVVHVASVIGGRGNIVRGINPGQKVIIYGRNGGEQLSAYPDIATSQNTTRWAILQAMAGAEAKNEYSVLSASINHSSYFVESGLYGVSLRQASNRFFVVQSAGQDGGDACDFAYTFRSSAGAQSRPNDGIMVVSGIKPDGNAWQGIEASNPIPGQPLEMEFDPNTGACVEAWAPGFEIPGLSYGDGSVRVSTGTSYSAPIVAALASRYSQYYRPIQKEYIIKNHLRFFNKYHANWPIYEVRYTTATGVFPQLLSPTKVYAYGTTTDLSYKLRNGKYYLPTSGDWFYSSGSSVQDIVIDMGSSANQISGVRVTPVASDYDVTGTYSVGYSNDPANIPLGGSVTEPHIATFAPIHIPLNNINARYLRIRLNIPSANSGISEIEVYSNPR